MKKFLSERPLFLLLLPLFYLLTTIYAYFPILAFSDIIHPLSLAILVSGILAFIVFNRLPLRQRKYALLILYLAVVYFFFGSLLSFFKQYLPMLSRYKIILPLLGTVGISLLLLLLKSKRNYLQLFLYLNTLLSIFVLMEIYRCAARNSIVLSSLTAPGLKKDPSFTASICDTCFKPDIYYVVFDGYSASRTLRDYWHYNNSALDSFLHQEKFYVASQSISNYNSTPYSIGSTLNMDYHKDPPQSIVLPEFCMGVVAMRPNKVFEILRTNGYDIVNQSFFPISREPTALDVAFMARKEKTLISQTLYSKIVADIGWNFDAIKPANVLADYVYLARIQRDQVVRAYDSLTAVAARPNEAPRFVYTHFLTPHDPYFFDSTGRRTPASQWFEGNRSDKDYLSQLKYVNSMIKNIVRILKNSKGRPAILILQSDHGYRGFKDPSLTSYEFNNLFAIYYPDQDYSQLYDSVSNVNTFPLIFNKYFHASLPLLKDTSFYIPRYAWF